MTFIKRILRTPSYGWQTDNGELVTPRKREIFREFFDRLNVIKSKKHWLSFSSWVWAFGLTPFLVLFFVNYFSWWLLLVAFLYSMVVMGCHGTIWYHRYSTHRTYEFSNKFWRFITQNLVVKVLAEEQYVVSHHVHHSLSDEPGDPYNAQAGWLYCFLADVNHQPIALDLNETDYKKTSNFLKNLGVKINSYSQYQKWGSISHPAWTWLHVMLNWVFWYGVFYLIGGHALACCLFGGAQIWAFGVRTFNYDGHGQGKDKRQEGFDFNMNDYSVNQYWPGYVAGEWHNNHHLFPNSARNGFLPSQLDLPWFYIKGLHLIGGVKSYRNHKDLFFEKHYHPHQEHSKPLQPKTEESLNAPT
ncbi:MAG: fatty acid desaturase [Marinoscillum sp.]